MEILIESPIIKFLIIYHCQIVKLTIFSSYMESYLLPGPVHCSEGLVKYREIYALIAFRVHYILEPIEFDICNSSTTVCDMKMKAGNRISWHRLKYKEKGAGSSG